MRFLILPCCVSVMLLVAGCADPLLGGWSITEIDYADGGETLQATRTQFAEHYSGKRIEFTDDEPHSFLVPVSFDGSVRGCVNGAWMRDPDSKNTVSVYRWVSGSMYNLWGHATLDNDLMRIDVVTPGEPTLVLKRLP